MPASKVAQLRAAMRDGNWRLALRMAARFDRLGPQRDAILSAHGAYIRPNFYRQIGKNPEALKRAGQRALIERYGR
jgi:hypothetical protein